jgi:AcrR family transcriptional regulator
VTTSKGTRLPPDERREQLVALGLDLLGRTPPDQVSIEAIARHAGISKGLLYHYFPTKSDFIVAVLRRSREELERRMAPDLSVPMTIGDRLDASLDAFLGYVEEHKVGFEAIARARAGEDAAIRAVIAENRARRVHAMVAFAGALAGAPAEEVATPLVLVGIEGWLAFCEGVVGSWLGRADLARDEVRRLMRDNLLATLAAAGRAGDGPAAAQLARSAEALRPDAHAVA